MRISITALILALLAGCAQNPVTGKSDLVMMSESQEIAEGRQADVQIKQQYKVYESKALQDYVNRVGQRIAKQSHRPGLQYHFTVLDSPEINAFALPGGYVYITRGILAYLNSEAELAAVLGHEIGHVTARHGVRQQAAAQATNLALQIASLYVKGLNTAVGQNVANLFGGALLSGYGRDHELEADRLGAQYLTRTEYDPQAIIKVIGVLKNQELKDAELAKQEGREPRRYHGLFASHPDNDTRLQQAVGEASKNGSAHAHAEGREDFLKATDGLVYGDNSDQGIVRNNRFYHADLGIALNFPETWQVHNLPDSLVAVSPRGEAMMQMKMDQKPQGTPSEYAHRMVGYGAQTRSLDLAGLPAATFELPNVMGGVIYHDKKAYIVQAQAKERGGLSAHRDTIFGTVRSFHALTADERKLVKPLGIRIITARPGDTYAGLAQGSPLGKSAESYLRLMNAQYPDGEPRPGQAIKIVE
ncbi:MAG: M48 family metalloprotease [Gallionella sp.]|jgi:predicted Zn-dependent protease|nr:M48 family metalloprotease [Gallionella sp.]MCK9352720.1 M48 family metalloprotease [Gallionella sp.]